MVAVQDYRLADLSEITSSSAQLDETRKQREELLSELGFKKLNAAERLGGAADKFDTARVLYPEMSGRQLRTWQRFLPTEHEIKGYNYDSVPTDALKLIKTAKDVGCFNEIVIWTPEGNGYFSWLKRNVLKLKTKLEEFVNSIDPMAVGIAVDASGNEHYFQIARWGEALLPIKKIKVHNRRVNIAITVTFAIVAALFVVAAGAFANGAMEYGWLYMFFTTLLVIVLGAFAIFILSLFITIMLDT